MFYGFKGNKDVCGSVSNRQTKAIGRLKNEPVGSVQAPSLIDRVVRRVKSQDFLGSGF